ncbi:hypothetical protein niasHT_040036 [Heterodera trifolii]|uniref:Uncharacterized protein n=1 Tax=Heterodera trifolii TaxID=157864 RepID=A0ABD2J2B4_9BILA
MFGMEVTDQMESDPTESDQMESDPTESDQMESDQEGEAENLLPKTGVDHHHPNLAVNNSAVPSMAFDECYHLTIVDQTGNCQNSDQLFNWYKYRVTEEEVRMFGMGVTDQMDSDQMESDQMDSDQEGEAADLLPKTGVDHHHPNLAVNNCAVPSMAFDECSLL